MQGMRRKHNRRMQIAGDGVSQLATRLMAARLPRAPTSSGSCSYSNCRVFIDSQKRACQWLNQAGVAGRQLARPALVGETAMPLAQRDMPPRSFGADDRPRCARCRSEMYVSRREPHPEHGPDYELQTLLCKGCDNKESRSVDEHGNPPR